MKSIISLLHRAEQNSKAIFAAQPLPMGAAGITLRQYSVLAAVAAEPHINQTRLTEATSIDRSTLADIVRRLHEKALVRRIKTADDRRNYSVTLTEKGKSAVDALRPVADVANSRLIETIPEKERRRFLSALEKLADIGLSAYIAD